MTEPVQSDQPSLGRTTEIIHSSASDFNKVQQEALAQRQKEQSSAIQPPPERYVGRTRRGSSPVLKIGLPAAGLIAIFIGARACASVDQKPQTVTPTAILATNTPRPEATPNPTVDLGRGLGEFVLFPTPQSVPTPLRAPSIARATEGPAPTRIVAPILQTATPRAVPQEAAVVPEATPTARVEYIYVQPSPAQSEPAQPSRNSNPVPEASPRCPTGEDLVTSDKALATYLRAQGCRVVENTAPDQSNGTEPVGDSSSDLVLTPEPTPTPGPAFEMIFSSDSLADGADPLGVIDWPDTTSGFPTVVMVEISASPDFDGDVYSRYVEGTNTDFSGFIKEIDPDAQDPDNPVQPQSLKIIPDQKFYTRLVFTDGSHSGSVEKILKSIPAPTPEPTPSPTPAPKDTATPVPDKLKYDQPAVVVHEMTLVAGQYKLTDQDWAKEGDKCEVNMRSVYVWNRWVNDNLTYLKTTDDPRYKSFKNFDSGDMAMLTTALSMTYDNHMATDMEPEAVLPLLEKLYDLKNKCAQVTGFTQNISATW